jgi:hypothetical protein
MDVNNGCCVPTDHLAPAIIPGVQEIEGNEYMSCSGGLRPHADKGNKCNQDLGDYTEFYCCPPSATLSPGVIVGVIFGLLAAAAAFYFLYYKKRSDQPRTSSTIKEPLLENDALEMGVMGAAASVVGTEKPAEEQFVVTAPEQVETFRVCLGFQISLCKAPDLSEKTGSTLLQGSTFEVDQEVGRENDKQVFLHAVGAGWTTQYHPKSGQLMCERAWSTCSRSEIDFEELKQVTGDFDQSLEIGNGGSCTVYRAAINSIPCAIKVLAQDAGEWEAKQFTSEVNLLRRVQHPNLCRFYACSTNGSRKCLVLEFMEGGALDKRMVAQPPLGWQQRVSIALGICCGLDYLHSLSPPMIHRDVSAWRVESPCCRLAPYCSLILFPLLKIKSQNILLAGYKGSKLDEFSTAKVADFGTVRADDRNAKGILRTTAKTHASTNMVVGTTPYMPPEVRAPCHLRND